MNTKRLLSIFLSFFILSSFFYSSPLLSEEKPDNTDTLISDMWIKIDEKANELFNSTLNQYKTDLNTAFKNNRNLDETVEGKEAINQLSSSFSNDLSSYMPTSDTDTRKNKYKSRISKLDPDKRDPEIQTIINEEINSVNSHFNSLLTSKKADSNNQVKNVEKLIEGKLINDLVAVITETRKTEFNKFKEDEDKILEDETKKEHTDMINEINKSELNNEEKQELIKQYENSLKKDKEERTANNNTIKGLSNSSNEESRKNITEELEDVKKNNPDMNYSSIKEKIIKANKDKLENLLKTSKETSKTNRLKLKEERLRQMKESIENLIKGKQKHEQMIEEAKKTQDERERLKEAEKKRKADFELRLEKFEEENRVGYITDDSVIKKIASCSSRKKIIAHENESFNYCKKWILSYDKLKLLKGKVDNVSDLDFKVYCKSTSNIKFSGNNPSISDNIGVSSVSTKELVWYTCDTGTLKGTECWENSRYVHVCDDLHCHEMYKKCVWGLVWFFKPHSCAWTVPWDDGRGSECRRATRTLYEDMTHWHRDDFMRWLWYNQEQGLKVNSNTGELDWNNNRNLWDNAVMYGKWNDVCVKDTSHKLKDATKNISYEYSVWTCESATVDKNVSLRKLYDPNFITFQ